MATTNEEEKSLFDQFEFIGFDEDSEVIGTTDPVKEIDEEIDEKVTKKEKESDDESDEIEFFEDDDVSKDKDTKKEKEEVAKETDSKKKETPSDQDSSSSFLQVLAKSLYEEGVLSSFDDKTEIKQATDFIELINKEIIDNVQSYKDDLPEEIKTLIEHYEEGVPLKDLLEVRVAKDEYKRIDPEKLADNEDLMKKLIRADLKIRGYEDDEIDDEIKDIFALDKEEARAKKALLNLQKRQDHAEKEMVETERTRQADEIKKRDDNIKAIRKTVDDTAEFAGITLSKQHKKEAFDMLMKPVAQINGRPVNAITKAQLDNPAEFQTKLALAFSLSKGFTDFSVFGKTAKSKTMVELEEQARKAAEKIKPGTVVKGGLSSEEDDDTPGSFLRGIRL